MEDYVDNSKSGGYCRESSCAQECYILSYIFENCFKSIIQEHKMTTICCSQGSCSVELGLFILVLVNKFTQIVL